jgi:hypothetical protein
MLIVSNQAIQKICSLLAIGILSLNPSVEFQHPTYDNYASTYNQLDDGILPQYLGIESLRSSAGRSAYGNVLEVAVGSGIQLPFYDWKNINTYEGGYL